MQGLEGIRIVEIAGGVGVAWAAKLLADLGADVIRVEDGHDTVRSRPDGVHRWLNTNKRSVTAGVDELVADAHLVLHDAQPAAAADRGLDFATLSATNPALVVCAITPFGSTGPYADLVAGELQVMHGSSWGFLSPGASDRIDLPPLKAPGHHATITTATVAATAALAAVDRAERSGVGEFVDFSIFAAGARMTETAPATAAFNEEDASRVGVKTVVPWGIYRCADGLVQFICVEQAQWESLRRFMGDPEWAAMDVFATNDLRRENVDLVELYLSEWMATQQVDELYRNGQAARLCISPMSTMAQLDRNEQFAARGFFATGPDGLRQPGPGFQVDQPWWRLRRAAPEVGEHDGEGWAAGGVVGRDRGPVPSPGPGRPLDGVRVCDFTWVWAGPYCNQLLAHLGADVVRLESPEHLCLFRRLPFQPPGMPLTPDTTGLFQTYNSDKRSLGIDLRRAEAAEIVRRLVARSDVVIENFAVGTLADLGFGVDDLRAINPDVIVVSLSGYGQTGPAASYMAYGPVGGAVAGLYAANGYEGGLPAETGVAVGDPCTGLTAAFATVAALVARRRTGAVARVDVAMVEAIAATLGELWMAYVATGESPAPIGNRDPQWAPHGCYPAAGEDRWVTVSCTSDEMFLSLCRCIDPSMVNDPRFATAAARKTNEDALDARIAAWTSARDRWDVTRELQAAGVAAFPSLSPRDLWSGDPQLAALGMLETPDHPRTGRRVVPGIPWRLTNGANGLRRPAPLLGQHTDEVLVELGFTPAEIDALLRAAVVHHPTAP